jgi:hypothetical protein
MPSTHSPYPRPAAKQLAHLYTTLGLSCPDIGWLYERDAKTVHYWLRQAGIPTRGRGTDPAQWLKPGDPRSFAGTKHSAETKARISASSKGRKPYLRGGQHWLHTVPADQNPNWKGGATPERQEFYRSPEWKAACRAVWVRDNAFCRNCGKDHRVVRGTEPTFHVHHVWSFQIRETRANPALMVLLCRGCHLWVHSNGNVTRAWLPQEPDSTHFPSLTDLDQVHYLQAAEREMSMPSLFDMEEATA